MNKYQKLSSLFLVSLTIMLPNKQRLVWAQPAPYTLKVTEKMFGSGKSAYSRNFMRLREAKTNRIIWTQEIAGSGTMRWSNDNRAVAVEDPPNVFVWREGEKLRRFRVSDVRAFGHSYEFVTFDYAMGCIWSPKNDRLLVRLGGSASTDIGPNGVGTLFCINFPESGDPWWLAMPSKFDVWKMSWGNENTVLYWPFLDTGDFDHDFAKKPRFWRLP